MSCYSTIIFANLSVIIPISMRHFKDNEKNKKIVSMQRKHNLLLWKKSPYWTLAISPRVDQKMNVIKEKVQRKHSLLALEENWLS